MTTTHHLVRIVAIVGIDGAGKTTQARLLTAWLVAQGYAAAYWPNPGGRRWFGRLAQRLGRRDARDLLGTTGLLVVETALRWAGMARALIVSRVRREIAVMDRYAACQYASIRVHNARTERPARWLFRTLPEPDLMVFLAIAPERAYTRIETRGTDHEELDYLTATDAAYRALPEASRYVVVDADRDETVVQRELRTIAEMLKHPAHTPTFGV